MRVKLPGLVPGVAVAALLAAWLGAAAPAHAGAAEAIPLVDELVANAESLGLPSLVERALVRPLERVRHSLVRGHEHVALLQLRTFELFVRLLGGWVLDPEIVTAALESAHVIRVAIAPGPPPALQNLAVAFGPWDPVTDRAGDFLFLAAEEKVFLEFGVVVPSPEGPKTLPTFEYRLSPDAVVVSPIDGIVERIEPNDEGDFALRLLAHPLSPVLVILDHVTDVAVAEGEAVSAGQALGLPGTWSASLGRSELQLFDFVARRQLCPLALADPALAADLAADVATLMDDWETFQGDATLYDQATMTLPGCLADSLPE